MERLTRIAFSYLLAVMTAVSANAQWMDVTDLYLNNPSFDTGNTDGWTVYSTKAQNKGFQGASYDNRDSGVSISRFVETWHPNSSIGETFIYQQVNLPKGTYRLSVDAIACWQHDGSVQPQGVYLYADTHGSDWIRTTPMASRNNNPEHFELEFELTEGSELYLGVKADTDNNCNWLAADNFKLEMLKAAYIDVTDDYILNPNYDNCDFSHWEGTSLSQFNGRDNAEHYEKTYDTYQIITGLTPGMRYRLSLSAFYRCGNSGQDWDIVSSGNYEDSQHARLYVETGGEYFDTGIALSGTGALKESLGGGTSNVGGWWDSKVTPNNMEAARYWFDAGYYLNQLEFYAGSDGVAKIGIRKEEWVQYDWTCLDTWRLEVYSDNIVAVKQISFKNANVSMAPGETVQLEVIYKPDNATVKKCTFASSNESVVKVDKNGVATAYAVGDATITATSADGSIKATCKISVKNAAYVEGGLVINEIQASNIDVVMDPSFNYGSWIELYNPTNKPCGIAGLYVTDDASNLRKHRLSDLMTPVPARGYKNIWFDHYGIWNKGELMQVNFKLNYDGGTIIISDGSKVLAKQTYPKAVGRASYARTTDGGSTWGMSSTPTPQGSNSGMTFATEQLPAPVVDKPGQVFSGSISVNVTIPSGATLRYTTDGSTPTMENGSTSKDGKFTFSNSQSVRFRLFQNGYLPSDVVTRSYLRESAGTPIISITTNSDNLYSTEVGIFETGPNGRAGNGRDDRCNWNMDWDRPANFEYITENNEYALSQEVDIATCGGWSRANWPKSFKIKAAKYYQGNNSLNYQFFEGKPFLKHKTLQIRNGGNDGSRLTDASLQEVLRRSGLNIETQSYKTVRVFINGQFYANLNMREPNNKHYAYANYGIDTDDMDQFEMSPDSGYVQMVGTKDAWNRLISLSENAANSSTYAQICQLLDVDQYINYMAAELYLGNWDWPQNNVKGFRDRMDGKFHFVIFDLDGSFSADINTFKGKRNYTFDRLRGVDAFGNPLGPQHNEDIEFVILFENLLKNETFRRKYVDALCVMGGSVFHPDFANPIVEQVASELGAWAPNITNRLNGRQEGVAGQLTWGIYDFGVNNAGTIKATLSSNVESAEMFVNDMQLPTGKFSGVLYNPVTVKAITPAGYKFKGWQLASGSMSGDYVTKTVFDKGASWSYYDGTSDLHGNNWKTAAYAKSWPTGNTPIGYDKDDNPKGLKTWVSNHKLPTYYFVKTFNISEKTSKDRFEIDFRVDDGMVIYINGKEAVRHNMPSGTITYNTFSSTWADNQHDYGTLELPNGLFNIGENVIAVEVHNNDAVSSDAHWNAALRQLASKDSGNQQYVSTSPEMQLTGSNPSLVAVYEPLKESELAANGAYPVKVNELSANNSMYVNDYFKKDDWVELYNTTDKSIDVAGMYLTNNANQPQMFQIPDNDTQQTIIEPHGHLVVWASNRNNKGKQVHANFKLSSARTVMLTSEDGSWSDKIDFSSHASTATVALYPDGGDKVYTTQVPTIGKANAINSYAKYLYTNEFKPSTPDVPVEPEAFTLTLNEGWNWISHPMESSIATSSINTYALDIKGQTAEATYDSSKGWVGSLTELAPGQTYKVKMSQSATYTFEPPFYELTRGYYLRSGWNWIGYPQNTEQTVDAALAKFTPSEGDKLMGRQGFATFEKGKWSGSLTTLQPGQGYMYKSAEPKSLTYVAAESNGSKSKAAPRFHAQPRSPWTVADAEYPDVMGVVAKVVRDGAESNEGDYCVGAFGEDGECQGVGRYIDGKLYINVFGNAGEAINFRAAEAGTGIVYDITEQLFFTSDIIGSRTAPLTLHIGQATDIASIKSSAALHAVEYYDLSGKKVGDSKSHLNNGAYILKYKLNDGSIITKKIIIK